MPGRSAKVGGRGNDSMSAYSKKIENTCQSRVHEYENKQEKQHCECECIIEKLEI
jgi:hypothetical protein